MQEKQNFLIRRIALRRLAACAVLVAMSFVLSLIQLPFPWLIYGGSVTLLSMVPVCMAGLMYGPLWGFGSAFVFSILQLLFSQVGAWGLSLKVLIVCIVFDYIIAYTVLGIAGFFKNRGYKFMCCGVAIAVFLRFLCHFFTGITIWEATMPETFSNIWVYSLVYNGSYMLPELIFTLIGTALLLKTPAFIKLLKSNS